jgi:EAL domain-containing protein (putative c-di-GMP-specific phosphodiesterase class I)
MSYLNYSIHLKDPTLLDRIKKAAKHLNISPGAFMREAAEKAVKQHEKRLAKARS